MRVERITKSEVLAHFWKNWNELNSFKNVNSEDSPNWILVLAASQMQPRIAYDLSVISQHSSVMPFNSRLTIYCWYTQWRDRSFAIFVADSLYIYYSDILNKEIMHLICLCVVFETIPVALKQTHYKNMRITISFYYQFARRTNNPDTLFIPRLPFRRGRYNKTNYLWVD